MRILLENMRRLVRIMMMVMIMKIMEPVQKTQIDSRTCESDVIIMMSIVINIVLVIIVMRKPVREM